jgi:hypothetical protein
MTRAAEVMSRRRSGLISSRSRTLRIAASKVLGADSDVGFVDNLWTPMPCSELYAQIRD